MTDSTKERGTSKYVLIFVHSLVYSIHLLDNTPSIFKEKKTRFIKKNPKLNKYKFKMT